jgi:alginate O-acetyltransferase complex protein AlgI
MGFKLMTNFNNPYQSKSVHEFWKRWHISLSSWFKDYLYISLGGNRVTIPRWYLNLFIVFLISGLWHGANWTFVIWGALHGFFIVFALITKVIREKFANLFFLNKIPFLAAGTTFILVTYAWIFFRSKDVGTSIYIASHIFTGLPEVISRIMDHQPVLEQLKFTGNNLGLSVLLIVILETIHYFQGKTNLTEKFMHQPALLRWVVYYSVVLAIIFLGNFEKHQFIYFQF